MREEGTSENLVETNPERIYTKGNIIQIYQGSIYQNSKYLLTCTVSGSRCGKITATYTTTPSNTVLVNFTVSPTSGLAFETYFTFHVKKMSNALLKCQFGFIDPNNYALIKLNDNFDSLNYTTLNETFATQLPIK